jgi:hypothetical protein
MAPIRSEGAGRRRLYQSIRDRDHGLSEKGFYKEKLPSRALASFPSWDKCLPVQELKQISIRNRRTKIPLRISTRPSDYLQATYYTVTEILALYGLSFAKIRAGAESAGDCRPTSGAVDRIKTGKINAVFDEGLHN